MAIERRHLFVSGGVLCLFSIIGSVVYHTGDVNTYFEALTGIYGDSPLYHHSGSSYPPLPYYLMAAVLLPLWIVGVPIEQSWLTMLPINLLFGAALLLLITYGINTDQSGTEAWTWFVLFNPVTLGVFIWSQSDALVAFGVGVALIALTREQWLLVGAGAMLGTSVKLYPLLMLVPLLVRRSSGRRRMLAGAGLVAVPVGILLAFDIRSALQAFVDPTHSFGIRTAQSGLSPNHPASLLGYVLPAGTAETIATVLFLTTLVLAIGWSVYGHVVVEDLRPVIVLLPLLVAYPTLYPYRWLPILIGIAWIGYTQVPNSRLVPLAWGSAILGGCYLLLRFVSLSGFTMVPDIVTATVTGPVIGSIVTVLLVGTGLGNVVLFAWAFAPQLRTNLQLLTRRVNGSGKPE